MTRILITGGRGVLGDALMPYLLEAGYQVRATSRHPPTAGHHAIEWWAIDLISDTGLADAVEGVDVIVHAASNLGLKSTAIDVGGTIRLLRHAKAADVSHFIYISIVGIDEIPLSYYKNKLAAEARIREAHVPWSILRATHFHSLLDRVLTKLNRLPFLLLPTDFRFQLIAPNEVAQRLFDIIQTGPSERLVDIGGPEILSLAQVTQVWLAAQKQPKRIVHLPLPGSVARAFRSGFNTIPDGRYGQLRWADWVAHKYGHNTQTVMI